MRRSALLLAPIAVIAAAAVAGCGSATTSGIDPVAKAAAATANTHGTRLAMTMTMTSDALPGPVHMNASGVLDQVSKQGEVTLDMSDLASAAGGSIDPSKLKMTEILTGPTVYIRMPLLDGKLPGNKKWMKVDISKLGDAVGLNLGQLMQPGQDPGQQLQYLRTVSGAKKVGTDTIRGVQTTHYRGVIKMADYPKLAPPSQRAQARAAVRKLIQLTGSATAPVDAWVDKQNLLRRMQTSMHMKIPNTGQSMTMNLQEDLFDFGVPVNVQPPPDSQVYDATKAVTGTLKQSGLGG